MAPIFQEITFGMMRQKCRVLGAPHRVVSEDVQLPAVERLVDLCEQGGVPSDESTDVNESTDVDLVVMT
jgi:hypothetical protein